MKIGKLAISEFESSLISKLDLMWIFSSDLQFVGVLITEYHLSNDRLEIVINIRVVAL